MVIRLSKTVLLGALALYFLLVVFNNLTDYGSNLAFVQHVLSMDTTFPDNKGMWRAITSPTLHHVFYILIILSEALTTVLCSYGSWRLWKHRQDPRGFSKNKKWGVYGLTMGLLIWLVGFVAIGGEWFLMWQSEKWNGLEVAWRISIMLVGALIYLTLPEKE